ncbi:MAG: NUDIX domain-containing protein [Marinilabilia sp.]
MYKIFFKDRAIILTDRIDTDLSPDFGGIHKLGSEGELRKFLLDFESNENQKEAYIYHHNKYELLKRFRGFFKNMPAAGGLVWNKNRDHFLVLHRLGRPDLPKGKVEPNENFEEAARREVSEECGIALPDIIAPIGSSFHIYYLDDQPVFKETRWFEMVSEDTGSPTPQKEEDISSVTWLHISEAALFANKTYPSIKEIVKKAGLV